MAAVDGLIGGKKACRALLDLRFGWMKLGRGGRGEGKGGRGLIYEGSRRERLSVRGP